MLLRIFLFLIGYALTVVGMLFIISYFNLISLGYNFLEYVNFIIRRIECLNALFGIIIMTLSISIGGNYELCI